MEVGFQGGLGFAEDIQGLLGEDSELDTLFLEESWTLGVEGALESWRRRQQTHAERERRGREFRELGSLGAAFASASDWFVGRAQLAGDLAGAPDFGMEALAAAGMGEQAPQSWRTVTEECSGSPEMADAMTQEGACRLLGVVASSTQEQIRTAFRRMVGRWHPDRFERGTEEARKVATERMIAINEAYRLLREDCMQECA